MLSLAWASSSANSSDVKWIGFAKFAIGMSICHGWVSGPTSLASAKQASTCCLVTIKVAVSLPSLSCSEVARARSCCLRCDHAKNHL